MNFTNKNITLFMLLLTVTLLVFAGSTLQSREKKPADAGPVKIGPHGILHKFDKISELAREEPVTPSQESLEKKEIAERLDTAGLLYTGKVVTDKDPKMLEPPESVARFIGKDFVVAKEPPEVEFAVIPVETLWLPECPVKSKSDNTNRQGFWTHYANAAYDTRTGKFWTAIGDHGMYGARIHLVEYDPAAQKVICMPEYNRGVLGKTKYQFADGKIHTRLHFYQSKQLDRPHLWFTTYWSKYPEPDEDDFQTGYEGGHIMSCDVLTGDVVDYGVPMIRASWPEVRIDKKRGIMYGVTNYGQFLAWDINEQQVRWCGNLPDGLSWYERTLMIDDETGMVYTTNYDHDNKIWSHGAHVTKSTPIHFIKYDPFKNRFFKLDCHVPKEREASHRIKKGEYSQWRTHTENRDKDGLYWCITFGGEIFTFDPVKEEVVDKGICCTGKGRYTPTLEMSPGERYLYYIPGEYGDGSTLIQYDTKTGISKALAFFYDYYFDKYGYTADRTYSIKLDDKGETLFVTWSGAFSERTEGKSVDTSGVCSVMLIHIPESERME